MQHENTHPLSKRNVKKPRSQTEKSKKIWERAGRGRRKRQVGSWSTYEKANVVDARGEVKRPSDRSKKINRRSRRPQITRKETKVKVAKRIIFEKSQGLQKKKKVNAKAQNRMKGTLKKAKEGVQPASAKDA